MGVGQAWCIRRPVSDKPGKLSEVVSACDNIYSDPPSVWAGTLMEKLRLEEGVRSCLVIAGSPGKSHTSLYLYLAGDNGLAEPYEEAWFWGRTRAHSWAWVAVLYQGQRLQWSGLDKRATLLPCTCPWAEGFERRAQHIAHNVGGRGIPESSGLNIPSTSAPIDPQKS